MKPLSVVVVGRGKVGRALSAAWRACGVAVSLRSGKSTSVPPADLVVLAVPDGAIAECGARIAVAARRGGAIAVVHCAGALGPEVLADLRAEGLAVGQMHPLISFAGKSTPLPSRARVLVQGDRRAVTLARRALRPLGLVAVAGPVEPMAYHAAAALVSNGAVALVAAALDLLVAAGIDRAEGARMLGPLLESTGANIGAEGLPRALTGPVRRGNAETVARHLEAIRSARPERLALYRELVRTQLEVARAFPSAERATRSRLNAIAKLLGNRPSTEARRRVRTKAAVRRGSSRKLGS